MKKNKILNFFLVSTLVCTAVYAQSYKISPTTTPAASSQYNVYTSNNYTSAQAQQGTGVGGIVEFVIDYSSSMNNVIYQAKSIVKNLYPVIPVGTKVGLRVFGQSGGYNPYTYTPTTPHDCVGSTTGACSSTVQVLPVGQYDGNTFYEGMEKYATGSATPLVYGLYLAINKDLANFPATSTKKIILITDGGENCEGNPCEFVQKLVAERSDIIIDVILISNYSEDFACLSRQTGGKNYKINPNDIITGNIFSSILQESIQSAPQVPNTESGTSTLQTQTQTQTQTTSNNTKYEYEPDKKASTANKVFEKILIRFLPRVPIDLSSPSSTGTSASPTYSNNGSSGGSSGGSYEYVSN